MAFVARESSRENRRIATAVHLSFNVLPMASLLAWRYTCLDNYIAVNRHLRGSLNSLLARFVPDPAAFLQMLTPWGALIVGEAALSHILHDPTLCASALELAVSNLYFHPFLDSLSRCLPSKHLVTSCIVKPAPNGFHTFRHITRIAEYRLSGGLLIVVYESSTPAACDVVSGYWTTALMNFVTPFTTGCAYPRLTFNHLALNCHLKSTYLAWWDRDMATRLERAGFDSAFDPDIWSLTPGFGGLTSPSWSGDGCGRALYVCPFQGRYFGDSGSLVIFYDGFCTDLEELEELCVAPFGPMATWRLSSTGTCRDRCVELDTVIPPFLGSMLTRLSTWNTAVLQPPDTRHIMSDATTHLPTVYPSFSRNGRRYSV